ncbi:MAG: hypothetical protein R3E08_01715 [Thiotrichaceae bacterium]
MCPNPHVGVWRVDFMPQWVAREYLAGAGRLKFGRTIIPVRVVPYWDIPYHNCWLRRQVPTWLLHVEHQLEIKAETAYDQSAQICINFEKHLAEFLEERIYSR